MKRFGICRLRDPENVTIDLDKLNLLGKVSARGFELADDNNWEKFLEELDMELGTVVLIAYNNGNVDAILCSHSNQWSKAVDEFLEWLDQPPDGERYEIFWRWSEELLGIPNAKTYTKLFPWKLKRGEI